MDQSRIEWAESRAEDGRRVLTARAENDYFVQVVEPLATPSRPTQSVLRVLARSPWWYGRAVISMDVSDDVEQAKQRAFELADTLQRHVEAVHGLDVEALKQRFTSHAKSADLARN